MAARAHRGVAADDPRNAGPIAFFAPRPVTRESARERLAPYYATRGPDALATAVEGLMARIARGVAPDPPLSQPVGASPDPRFGLGTHPDLVEELWELEGALPRRCRWLLWGRPALVHPATGVVFAVGIGTLGLAVRLPPAILASATADQVAIAVSMRPAPDFDLSAAGPEWRFLLRLAPKAEWSRAAFDVASTP